MRSFVTYTHIRNYPGVISRRMPLVGHVIYKEENRYAYRVLVEKTVGKRHFVRP
jgi:hypothetical protein